MIKAKLFIPIMLITCIIAAGCKPENNQPASEGISQSASETSIFNTIFLIDLSGSMNELADDEITRLEASIAAAGTMLDVISAEQSNPASRLTSSAALVTFAYEGNLVTPLTNQTNAVKFAMQDLQADGGTNLADGLQKALLLLEGSHTGKNQIILLSDGLPTFSANIEALRGDNISQADKDAHSQDLQNEVLAFSGQLDAKEVCLHLIAFDPAQGGDANPEFLEQLAASVDCGYFYQADDIAQLYAAFLSIWQSTQGNIIDQHSGQLALQNDATTWSFEVPAGQSELIFSSAAIGSGLSVFLIDPKDSTVNTDYEGAFIQESGVSSYISVRDPRRGTWQAYVKKEAEGHTPVQFTSVVSIKEAPPAGFPVWLVIPIVFVITAAALGGLYYFAQKKGFELPWKKILIAAGAAVLLAIAVTLVISLSGKNAQSTSAVTPAASEDNRDAETALQTLQASVALTHTPQITQAHIVPGEPWGKIVFTCQVDRKFDHDQICIINADGSGFQQLTDDLKIKNTYPTLSEDGQTILFSSNRKGGYEIFEMKTDGTSIKQITANIGECSAPDVSPDGKKIVFERRIDDKTYIATMDRDGSNVENVNDYLNARDPVWSPDGKEILFTASPARKFQIYRMNADGTNPRRITALNGLFGRADWAEDGMMVSYSGSRDAHTRELFLFNEYIESDLITEGGDNITPSFSPDGEWVAFMSYRDHFWHEDGCEIYIMRLDDQKTIRLTDNFYCDYQPRWGK